MISPYQVRQITPSSYESYNDEPMGSKQKFWFDDQSLGRCLFKYNRVNTGEHWAEKIAEQLSELLSLPHARYELAQTWQGDWGIVSPNFVPKEGTLIHGNEILFNIDNNYPTMQNYKVSQYAINFVLKAISSNQAQLPPNFCLDGINQAVDLFVGYLLLDAWIGNGDRHHENWGFISQKQKSKNLLYLAPTYDHASSLGRELLDLKRQTCSVQTYASKCRSAFYKDTSAQKPFKTFELFAEITNCYPRAANTWLNRLKDISSNQIDLILQSFPSAILSQHAAEFAKKILIFNHQRLLLLKP